MKNALFVFAFASFAFFARAQDSTITLGKFEKLSSAAGVICRFDEMLIGEVRSTTISIVKLRAFNRNDTSSVIRIAPASSYKTIPIISNTTLYIEKEDIDEVVKLLDFYAGQLQYNGSVTQPYFRFITSNNIQILCRFEEDHALSSYLTIGKIYQQLRTPVENSSITFNRKKDIDKLILLLKEAAKQM